MFRCWWLFFMAVTWLDTWLEYGGHCTYKGWLISVWFCRDSRR